VAGIYPTRAEPIRYNVRYLDKPQLWADPVTKLLEVQCAPTGFMKISRNCITKMIEAYPKTGFHHESATKEFYPLFDYIYSEELKYKFGEDYSFCIRWRDIGGQVWIDPEISMGHIGL
jgi:hypothetical protein